MGEFMSLRASESSCLFRGSAACAVILLGVGPAAIPALADAVPAPALSLVKIVNGKFTVDIDNGWVVYQDLANAVPPSLRRFVQDPSGAYTATPAVKLKTAGAGPAGNGAFFNVGGIAFASCPVGVTPSRCAQTDFGTTGVGLAFGQTTFGAGSAAAGWVNDNTVTANFSDADFNTTGSVAGVAADATNGAFAVGWTLNFTTFTNHGLIMTLDTTQPSYQVVDRRQLDNGALGGTTSQALAISYNALHVVGIALDATGKGHAVYTPSTGASSWTDITGSFPSDTIKSRAFAVSNTGIVAGSITVKRMEFNRKKSVDIGFVYDTNTAALTVFEAPGANVIPQAVLDDGRVVGNLELLKAPGSAPGLNVYHPFMFDGTLHDFGVMGSSYACRSNRPNNLGQVVGSCIPNASTAFGVKGSAFYIDTVSATPVFVDLNASIHAKADTTNPTVKPYTFGTATSIDNQQEIVVLGLNKTNSQGNFIASQPGYLP
jgi:hypothetical protein